MHSSYNLAYEEEEEEACMDKKGMIESWDKVEDNYIGAMEEQRSYSLGREAKEPSPCNIC